jgi:large subunit ribosomal protein L24
MQRIKKGDEIIVIAGKDKGRRGTILRVDDNKRVVVEGVNVAKKHQKANPNAGVAGGIVDIEMPLDRSNVALYNPITKKADRIGIKTLEDGRKVRFFKSNNEVVDV